jgi:hypothetical protein
MIVAAGLRDASHRSELLDGDASRLEEVLVADGRWPDGKNRAFISVTGALAG